MSSMEIETIVNEYFRRLEHLLDPLPSTDREQLIQEIHEHVGEARAGLATETEVAVRDLLEHVGRPEDIATEALGERPRRGGSRSPRTTLRSGVAGVVVVVVAVVLAIVLSGRSSTHPPTTTTTRLAAVVPDVRFLQKHAAVRLLANHGFIVAVLNVHSSRPAGTVVAQKPSPGAQVGSGGVRINVSEGKKRAAAT